MPSYQGWQGDKPLHTVKLPENWIKHCVKMPESGMGYQKVIVKTNQKSVRGIILNCSILETVEPVEVNNIIGIELG